MLYPDAAMRLALSRAVALETPRGWRLAKENQSHKIDVIVALAMACHGAMQSEYGDYDTTGNWIDGGETDQEAMWKRWRADVYWSRYSLN
jgi:hypothetical protein